MTTKDKARVVASDEGAKLARAVLLPPQRKASLGSADGAPAALQALTDSCARISSMSQ